MLRLFRLFLFDLGLACGWITGQPLHASSGSIFGSHSLLDGHFESYLSLNHPIKLLLSLLCLFKLFIAEVAHHFDHLFVIDAERFQFN